MNYKKKTGARGGGACRRISRLGGIHDNGAEPARIARRDRHNRRKRRIYCIRGGEDPRADQSEQTLWTTSRRGELHQEPEADKVSRGISP